MSSNRIDSTRVRPRPDVLAVSPLRRRVTVDRGLYACALADAIDWEASFCASHDGTRRADQHGPGDAHCGPDAYGGAKPRCEAYSNAHALLARYRSAQAALTRIAGESR